ncbi:cytochrome c biogenesis protein CcsA [Paenibacillus sp. ACRRX]|uniref:cytochrome C assembly family protein n=1 Tax=unclassified Paenibacillus TaxID=185978 RepID=UPI001EF506F1|nr:MULTISPECIES: cytochrome c biogenesis protein CcsA [unclassified Paenibacillus]MCG7410187.1 cytochrome c biogenesis protein CcsA [Paenibacillus sp. ACRRX]MDK8183770.1 cytochrome c biogenesis protein CcsA [Paenibacillus sp. UMB4589-SE434]
MVTSSWTYDAIIYTYALSLLFYFSDVVGVNRRAKRMGTGLLIFVWVLQTVFLLVRVLRHQDVPMFSSFEFMFLFSWILVTTSLVISRFFHIEFIVFFVNLIGFALLIVNMLNDPTAPSVMKEWEMMRNVLTFHIALAACGFAALTVSAIYAAMYAFLHQRLKSKKWSDAVRRLPSLERMERSSFIACSIGMPLFLLSLSVAVVAVLLGNRMELLLDFKVWFTIAVLVLYGVYLIKRRGGSLTGLQIVCFNMICYAVMLLNYGLNAVSTFHRWMGA